MQSQVWQTHLCFSRWMMLDHVGWWLVRERERDSSWIATTNHPTRVGFKHPNWGKSCTANMDFMWVNALKASSTMTSTHAALGIALGIYHSLCPFRQQSSSIETRHLQKCHTMNHPILGIWLEQPWVLSHHLLQLYIPMWYTSPPEIGSTQTKQGTGAWRAGSAVTLGTSVLGIWASHREFKALAKAGWSRSQENSLPTCVLEAGFHTGQPWKQ